MSLLNMKIDQVSLDVAVMHLKENCSSSDLDFLASLPRDKKGFESFKCSEDWRYVNGRKPAASVFKMPDTDILIYSPASKCFQFFWIESEQSAYIVFDLDYDIPTGIDGVFSYVISMLGEGWQRTGQEEFYSKIPYLLI